MYNGKAVVLVSLHTQIHVVVLHHKNIDFKPRRSESCLMDCISSHPGHSTLQNAIPCTTSISRNLHIPL